MFSSAIATHIKIVNLWLISVLIMVIGSRFTHWENVEPLTWVNCSLLFLLFLQSVFISRKEIAHRSLFINLAMMTVFSSIQIINVFIGEGYALGGNAKLMYELYFGRSMIMPFLAAYTIFNLLVTISFRNVREWLCSAVSLFVVSAVALFLFRDILFRAPLIRAESITISQQALKLLLLPLVGLIGYWVYQFRRDPPLSEHIKVLLGFFFVYLVIELTDLFTTIYNIKRYAVSQVVLLSVLLFLSIILFNRLNYLSSEYGQYFERLLLSGNPSGIPIVRKKSQSLKPIAAFVHKYFVEKPVMGAFAVIGILTGLMYVHIPVSAIVNLGATAFAFLLLMSYWWGLSRKRTLENDILKFQKKPTLTY